MLFLRKLTSLKHLIRRLLQSISLAKNLSPLRLHLHKRSGGYAPNTHNYCKHTCQFNNHRKNACNVIKLVVNQCPRHWRHSITAAKQGTSACCCSTRETSNTWRSPRCESTGNSSSAASAANTTKVQDILLLPGCEQEAVLLSLPISLSEEKKGDSTTVPRADATDGDKLPYGSPLNNNIRGSCSCRVAYSCARKISCIGFPTARENCPCKCICDLLTEVASVDECIENLETCSLEELEESEEVVSQEGGLEGVETRCSPASVVEEASNRTTRKDSTTVELECGEADTENLISIEVESDVGGRGPILCSISTRRAAKLMSRSIRRAITQTCLHPVRKSKTLRLKHSITQTWPRCLYWKVVHDVEFEVSTIMCKVIIPYFQEMFYGEAIL